MTTPFSRSLINQEITVARKVAAHFGMALPPLAWWNCQDWERTANDCAEIRDCMLGWDVTDFGSGDFYSIGRVLFTLRNGRHGDAKYPKPYAEKLLIDPEDQRAPAHFHQSKREDIICRGGGNILVQLTKAGPDDQPSQENLAIQLSGQTVTLPAGGIVRLAPGESVTIPPRTIHQFWSEQGTGIPLEGRRFSISSEISSVCDDLNDNVFFNEDALRFPKILENEDRIAYLCHEYPRP